MQNKDRIMENTDTFDAESPSISDCNGYPRSRGWQCTKLTDVRRRLVDVIKRIEKNGSEKTSRDAIQYYRLLVYSYQCLASIIKDSALEDIEARLSALEEKRKKI
jgi:hypothetical protein